MSLRRSSTTKFVCALALSGASAFAPAGTFLACSGGSHNTLTPSESVKGGQASVVALALTASNVASVTVTVSGGTIKGTDAGIGTPLAFPMQKSGSQWTTLISNLPAGTGFTFALSAVDSRGNPLYQGSANSVTITAGKTAQVAITAQQVISSTPFANAAPVIDSIVVSATSITSGGSVNLVVAAHDPNAGDTLTYAWSAAYTATVGGVSDISSYGTFSAASSYATSWTAPAATGTYGIIIRVQDSKGATVIATTTVNVAAVSSGQAQVNVNVNTWPVVTNVVGSPNYLVQGQPTFLTAQANDSDNDPLTYAWSTSCPGTLSNPAIPTPSFTLANSSTSTACTFSVIVSDNRGGSDTGTLTLPVGAPSFGTPAVPVISSFSQSSPTVGAGQTVSFSIQASDPSGTALAYSWSASDGAFASQVDSSTGSQIIWTPPANAAASWRITVTAKDASGLQSAQTFTVTPSSCFGAQPTTPSWTFGIISDTQWATTDDGRNPNSVAVDVIKQIDAQFIASGVSLVVAVGDVTDNGSNAGLDTRARWAQELYNAGIGFYPLRGNHEPSAVAAKEFVRVFPQTQNGSNNSSPSDVATFTSPDDTVMPPPDATGSPFLVGTNFTSPPYPLTGLSYSFTYNNATFVLLDGFTPPDNSNNTIDAQQTWINASLAAKPAGGHAFVFGHKGIITESHVDVLFGSDPSQDPTGTDAFISSLMNSGVRWYIGGHDHMHNRAIVTTTDGKTASVQDIITVSDSSKFNLAPNVSSDLTYDVPAFGHPRETEIIQEFNTIGYYIVTITGGRANVDFYSYPISTTPSTGGQTVISVTPPLVFTKRESFGYGLNGKEFLVHQGGSYTSVTDSSAGSVLTILAGTNTSNAGDPDGRSMTATVDTSWAPAVCSTFSPIVTLWITPSYLGSAQTDTYVPALTFNATGVSAATLSGGAFGLATRDSSGNWVNAVNKNLGGTPAFVAGPWTSSAPLGTYGVDPATGTAWAVVNYSADFAVAAFTR